MANSGVKLLVAPDGKSQTLFSVVGDELRRIVILESWPPDALACTNDTGWFACLESTSAALIGRYCDVEGIKSESRISAPEDVRLEAITFAGNRLFGGGIKEISHSQSHDRRPWIGWCDVTVGSDWIPVELNSPACDFIDKGVDALVVTGTLLMAFDNIIEPLYLLILDLANKELGPTHTSTMSLKTHNTYERIKDARTNDSYIAILSTGINQRISGQYISICNPSNMGQELCLFSESRSVLSDFQSEATWTHIAIAGSTIFVAACDAGLGVGDILYEDGIAYVRDIGRVDRVTTIDNDGDRVIISAKNGSGWSTCLVPVSLNSLRDQSRQSLVAVHSELKALLAEKFELRFGLNRIDLFTSDPAIREKYQTAKVAEIQGDTMRMTVGNGGFRTFERLMIGLKLFSKLTRIGIEHDPSLYDEDISFSLAGLDSKQIRQALECVIESINFDGSGVEPVD